MKAADILAEVALATSRRDEIHAHFRALPAERWNDNTSYCYRLRLEEAADKLADYIRRLPAPVKNKQSKAVAKATAFAAQLRNEALVVYKH